MEIGEIYLKKYKIIEILKKNKNVCVAIAKHIGLNSKWIIKRQMNNEYIDSSEVDLLKGLRHTGIPLVVDIINEQDNFTFIREYINGKTLTEFIECNNISEKICIEIFIKICEILEYLHDGLDAPLIYRDIKPDNIIIDENLEVYLIDFGIARFYNDNKIKDTVYLGTRGFAAPEQYSGTIQSSKETDIFGLGATMYYMLTKEDFSEFVYKIEPVVKIRTDISKKLSDIIMKACEIRKEKRYSNVKELKNKLITLKEENRKTFKEWLISKKAKKYIISGIKKGIGCTYTSMIIAKILASDSKTLIIDCSEKQELLTMEYQMDSAENEGILSIENIDIVTLKGLQKKTRRSCLVGEYESIVIDIGLYKNIYKHDLNDLKESEKFLISGISPWEKEELEEILISPKENNDFKLLMNFSEINEFENYKNQFGMANMYYLPYIPNFFDKNINEIKSKYCDIIKREGENGECLEKITFLEKLQTSLKGIKLLR